MAKNMFLIVVSFFILNINAKKIDFIEADFTKFVDKVIADKQAQEPFKSYYTALCDSLQKGTAHKRTSTERYLVRLGLTHLRTTHPEWYSAIEPYMTEQEKTNNLACDADRIKITKFLIRYGAYEEFKTLDTTHQKAQVFAIKIKQPEVEKHWWQQAMSTVKNFAVSAYNTVTNWFLVDRPSTTAAV